MPRTAVIETEVYKFSELSPEAQQVAIEARTEEAGQAWEADSVKDDWKQKLEALGFGGVEINYSGFWSQGDGARFTAESFDLEKILKASGIAKTFPKFYAYVKRKGGAETYLSTVRSLSSQYYHENTVKVELEEYGNYVHAEQEQVTQALTTYVRGLCQDIYSALEASYDADTSEEYARECLTEDNDENEYKENGKRYY